MIDQAAKLKEKEALFQKKNQEQETLKAEIAQLKSDTDEKSKNVAEEVKQIQESEVD